MNTIFNPSKTLQCLEADKAGTALDTIGCHSIMTTRPQPCTFKTLVVVPARNEERRIGQCLASLARQQEFDGSDDGARMEFGVIVVANNCHDFTSARAFETAYGLGLPIWLLNIDLAGDQGVGAARAAGFEFAASLASSDARFLTTDADCIVAPNWISASLKQLETADGVCGKIIGNPQEESRLPDRVKADAALEQEYTRLSVQFRNAVDPDLANPGVHHAQAGGASLGFTRQAYEAIGGFSNLLFNEDRDIVARLKEQDFTIVHADDVRVTASCRTHGRAPQGMADAIAQRIAEHDSFVDQSLEPASVLILRTEARLECRYLFENDLPMAALTRRLGIDEDTSARLPKVGCFHKLWAAVQAASPLLERRRLRPSGLPAEIARLEAELSALQRRGEAA